MDGVPYSTVYQDTKRVLIPKTTLLIFLGIIFYLGIWFNLKLLKIQTNTTTQIIIIIGIIVLLTLQIFFDYLKISKNTYQIYSDKIIYTTKKPKILPYQQATMLNFKRDFLDQIFNTGTIELSQNFKIEHINDFNSTYFYLQKTIRPTTTQTVIPQNYQQYYQNPQTK